MAKFRNSSLTKTLNNVQPRKNLVEANNIPQPNTTNRQGHASYAVDKWMRLLTMLNTLKLENQYYRNESDTMRELKSLIDECAKEDPYFVAQNIVYSRCVGEGMRSINHLAASYLAPHCAGREWAKRFYSLWDKKTQSGGTIFRPDDMAEIIAAFSAMNAPHKATNSMKKGFASALEKLDAYSLLKYKSGLIDIINLVHPNPNNSKAQVEVNGEKKAVLSAIMKGDNVSADIWEVAQSGAGQIVAKAVKEGKLTNQEAEQVLQEAKAENWEGLLTDNKLGILAAVRNIRNILKDSPKSSTINKLCNLFTDGESIKKGRIMPYQLDLAQEVVNTEFSNTDSRKIVQALLKGYETSIPNLAEILTGRNLVIVDMSGSMRTAIQDSSSNRTKYKSLCIDKAALIASTIAKATGADIIRFGSSAEYVSWNPNADVFTIANAMKKDMGGTSLHAAWQCATSSGRQYDRIFILSDNEANVGNSYNGYTEYIRKTGSPYVYSVDLAAYGTTQVAGDKVKYYYGYGLSLFDDIVKNEFNPTYHMDKVKAIKI